LETLVVKEIAAIMGLKPATVYQKIWKNTMPFPAGKSGRRLLFFRKDVENWMAALPEKGLNKT